MGTGRSLLLVGVALTVLNVCLDRGPCPERSSHDHMVQFGLPE